MAKIKETVTIPARPAKTEEQVTGWKCELCGAKTDDDRAWPKAGEQYNSYRVRKVEVTMEEGASYPSGGTTEETIVDLCPECFKTKLLPWIESQGGKARTEDRDW